MNDKWLKAENVAKKIVITVILAGGALALFVLIPKIMMLCLPFIIAYIISLIASPLTKILEKIKCPRAVSAIISILFVAALLFGVSAAVINKIVSEVYDFSLNMPQLYDSVTSGLSKIKITAIDFFNLLPDEASPYMSTVFESLQDSLTALSSGIVEFISASTIKLAKHVPGLLISVVFSILASYFLIRDKKVFKRQAFSLLGDNISSKLSELKNYLFEAVFAYIRAQGILMSITFAEAFIGLSILNVKYSFLLALVIAFIDAIPIFGTGTILIPWALYHIITGNYSLAIGLLIIYAVCVVVRQLLEPKILSSQIGLPPLLTLFAMYAGYRFIGIFGMILGPVVALIAKNFIEKYKEKHKTPEA